MSQHILTHLIPQIWELAPCNFWLFPEIQMTIKGQSYDSTEDIEAAITAQLKPCRKEVSRAASESSENDGISGTHILLQ